MALFCHVQWQYVRALCRCTGEMNCCCDLNRCRTSKQKDDDDDTRVWRGTSAQVDAALPQQRNAARECEQQVAGKQTSGATTMKQLSKVEEPRAAHCQYDCIPQVVALCCDTSQTGNNTLCSEDLRSKRKREKRLQLKMH